ncbi:MULTISPECIES: GNAT family protein [unclassified Yoonia]|uniref:GNAT family N-acetyltransferase n=1 Tax=unclassified Yoonia TaxID=2629118 RepID=UPI002AFEFFBC|nr:MULTISPECIES: GNAT family protein [unclassified Yoonia]
MAIEPIHLSGRYVTLAPLMRDHHDGLVAAVQDGALWQLWYTTIPTPDAMEAEIDRRLTLQAAGTMLPFTVLEAATGKVVGMTTYMNIDADSPRVEIGSTFYASSVQRTSLNTEAKLLLLSHAFEDLGCLAVEFRTHVMNQQSRRAIERLGAKLDGILRQHMRMPDGSLRDTCVYSIIASEWPMIRRALTYKLDQYSAP